MSKWNEGDIPDLTGKLAVVTGGASGIGFETARALARRGATVIIADRNQEAGKTAVERILALKPGADVRFAALDLGSLQKVRDFAIPLVAAGRPLDLLINNAGIQPISERRVSVDGFELTFAIGHLGHFALTGLLLPLLNTASNPRVVTVSSLVHGQGYFDWNDLQIERNYASQRAYNQTKLANLLFAREFQRRLDAVGGKIVSVSAHPGVARTAIGANRKNLGKFRLGDYFVSAVLSVVMPFLGQPAAAGALPTLFAATAQEVKKGGFYGPDGFGGMKGAPKTATIRTPALDINAAQRLWAFSEQATGIHYP